MIIEFQWSLLTENSEQRWQSVVFESLWIEGAKYVALKVFLISFKNTFEY
jgi:hypothetical protein